MATQRVNHWQMAVRIGYLGLLLLASVPWHLSGSKTPILCGAVGAVVGISIASLPRAGFMIALAVTAITLGLLGLDFLTSGPSMSPLQIDEMSLSGIRYGLPVALLFGPIAAHLAKGTASEEEP
jgi:hypothetical protein